MPKFVKIIFLGSRTFTRYTDWLGDLWTDSDNGGAYYFHYVEQEMKRCRERIYVK